MARAPYVYGQQIGWPNGVQWVSGPFDDREAAWREMKRLRPFYPDATLSVRERRGKSLPTCTPRTGPPGEAKPTEPAPSYDLKKRPERERLAADLQAVAERFGASVVVENWDGEPDVTVATPSLRATIWCVSVQGEMPIISWYGAAYPLRAVPGAWTADQVNDAHRRKASSLPGTWSELFDALEIGVCAAIDGSAFVLEEPA